MRVNAAEDAIGSGARSLTTPAKPRWSSSTASAGRPASAARCGNATERQRRTRAVGGSALRYLGDLACYARSALRSCDRFDHRRSRRPPGSGQCQHHLRRAAALRKQSPPVAPRASLWPLHRADSACAVLAVVIAVLPASLATHFLPAAVQAEDFSGSSGTARRAESRRGPRCRRDRMALASRSPAALTCRRGTALGEGQFRGRWQRRGRSRRRFVRADLAAAAQSRICAILAWHPDGDGIAKIRRRAADGLLVSGPRSAKRRWARSTWRM